jgi:cytochrome c-type biogenesis protein CcmH/NrfG
MLDNVRQRAIQAFENHLNMVPEDARAHVLLAADYAAVGRYEDAMRSADLAVALRPNDPPRSRPGARPRRPGVPAPVPGA